VDPALETQLRYRAKEQIRKRMRALRNAIPNEARLKRSHAIAERVRALDAWATARVIAGYVAMRGEADPAELLAEARSRGREVALPRVDFESETLTLHLSVDGELEESGMGFLQPPKESPQIAEHTVDLVLVPALASDERGYRIGWGKGFYDRLLPTMPRAMRVALLFDFQLVAEVPSTPGDERVDCVVTDTRTLAVTRTD
jgi:5-formyltetrahydrofolate cyclo-ligase